MNRTTPRFPTPSPNGSEGDGRDAATGRFAPGWRGGPGNPFASRVAAYRSAIYDAVSPQDLRNIMQEMVRKAKKGDVAAAKIVFERCAGKPQADVRHIIGADEALKHAVERQDRLGAMLGNGNAS